MATEKEVVVKISSDARQFRTSMRNVTTSAKSAGSSIKKAFQKANDFLKRFLKVTIGGLTAAVAFSAREGARFEDAMMKTSAVATREGEKIGDTFDTLSTKALEMGRTTVFSSEQAAQGMYDLASAGFEVNDIMDAITPTIRLAVATGADLGKATELTATTLKAFNLEANQTQRVADVFTKAITTSRFTVDRLRDAMKFAGPAGAAFGMTLEETTAVVAQFLDVGLGASQAGTTLRMSLSQLTKETAKGKEALARYKLSYDDINPETKNFAEILNLVAERAISAKDATAIFGVRSATVISAVSKRIQGNKKLLDDYTKGLKDAAGTTDRLYTEMMKTTAAKAKLAQSSVSVAAIRFFGLIKPLIDSALVWVANAFDSLSLIFELLKKNWKTTLFWMLDVASAWALALVDGLSAAWTLLKSFFSSVLNYIQAQALDVVTTFNLLVSKAIGGAELVSKAIIDVSSSTALAVTGRLIEVASAFSTEFRMIPTLMRQLLTQASAGAATALKKFEALPAIARGAMKAIAPNLVGGLKSVMSLIDGAIESIDEKVDTLDVGQKIKDDILAVETLIKAGAATASKAVESSATDMQESFSKSTEQLTREAELLRRNIQIIKPFQDYFDTMDELPVRLKQNLEDANRNFAEHKDILAILQRRIKEDADATASAQKKATEDVIKKRKERLQSISETIKELDQQRKLDNITAQERLAQLDELMASEKAFGEEEIMLRQERSKAISDVTSSLDAQHELGLISHQERVEQIQQLLELEHLSHEERAGLLSELHNVRKEAYGEIVNIQTNFTKLASNQLVSLGDAWANKFAARAIKSTNAIAGAVRGLLAELLKILAKKALLKILGIGGGTSAKGVPGITGGGDFIEGVSVNRGTGLHGISYYQGGSAFRGATGPPSGRDIVPAALTPGEIVLNPSASDLFREMAMFMRRGAAGGAIYLTVVNRPTLLGDSEQLIQLQEAQDRVKYIFDRREA